MSDNSHTGVVAAQLAEADAETVADCEAAELVTAACPNGCDFQTEVARGALSATSCPDCQAGLEVADDGDDGELVTDGGTVQTADRPNWTPTGDDGPTGKRCQNCGAQVSREFRRVMGDENWVAHACPQCTENRNLPREASNAGGGLR